MLAPPPLPRTLEASLRDIGSERPATRASAATDLTRHASRDAALRAQALPLLEKMLAHDPSPVPRAAAAVALGDLHAEEALPALLLSIEDADVNVRQMALNALGEIGDARAAPRLARALADARPEVRYQAIIAYVKVADVADTAAALARSLDDEDPAVRYIALRIAEERADDPSRGAGSPESPFARRAAALLRDADAHVALAAAIFLAKTGDTAARARILAVVRGDRSGGRPEKEDEQEAVELAGRLDMRDAIPDLERRAWGLSSFVRDTCAWHAKIALGRMGHPRAVAEILREVSSARRDVRIAAVVAAGRARVGEARAALEQAAATTGDEELSTLAVEALAKLA
jgi:HEAT repeat protein